MSDVPEDYRGHIDMESATATPFVKQCPFCKTTLMEFGQDVRNGKVVDTYIHPRDDDTWDRCPLSGLVFDFKRWNTRPLEDALRARIARLEVVLRRISDPDAYGQVNMFTYATRMREDAQAALETREAEK